MKYHRRFQWLAIPFVTVYDHIKYDYHVIGRENIPEGGCVVVANHSQWADPTMVATALGNKHDFAAMAKKELFQKKIFAWLIAALGAFPIDREGADITAIKTALGSVRAGQKLIIFPQGTRGASEDEAKDGAAMLAMRTHAPIVPMYISENKHFRSHVVVRIGKPFLPEGGRKDYAALSHEILRRIYALRDGVDG